MATWNYVGRGTLMQWIILVAVIISPFLVWFLLRQEVIRRINTTPEIQLPDLPAPIVQVDLEPLRQDMRAVPNKVLTSIQNATNTEKGKVAEYIGYLQLNAQYDRIVPLGNIVDFMCVKFPEKGSPGQVDFIDIKTGKSSRLSRDQRNLQRLIEERRIGFKKVQITTTDCISGPTKSGEQVSQEV